MKSRLLFGVLLTGILGVFIHPTVLFGARFPQLGFLGWFFMVPLFYCLRTGHGQSSFRGGFFSAIIFHLGSLYWLVPAMTNFGGLAVYEASGLLLLVVLILSFYAGLALLMSCRVGNRLKVPFFLCHALFLTAFDFFRTYVPVNGFPWSMTVYSQAPTLQLFQWIDTVGIFGLDWLIYLVNGLLAEILYALRRPVMKDLAINRGILLIFVFLLSAVGSILRQSERLGNPPGEKPVGIALVQANISQQFKWDPQMASEHFQRHLRFTTQAQVGGAKLVIWPESAYPFTIRLADLTDHFFRDRESIPLPVLFGSVSQEERLGGKEPVIYNSTFLMQTDGTITGLYHKRHLVPFGEYVPMKEWLRFARRLTVAVGDFTPGKDASPIPFGDLKIGFLICYEDIFPDLSRESVKRGANFLVNQTNDAWYGNTSAQYQHLAMSQFRALETRRYLVRATNTGMTAVIEPTGKILDLLPPFSEGVLIRDVWPETEMTPYVLYGDLAGWGAAIFSGLFFVASFFKRKTVVS